MTDTTTDEPATLAASVDKLADETALLRHVMTERFVPRDEFDHHRRNVLVAVGLAAVLLVVALVAVAALAVVVDGNRQLIDSVGECTTAAAPGSDDPHECYDAGQQRTAELVGELIESNDANTQAILDQLQTSP